MKRFITIVIGILMIFLVGCTKEDAHQKENIPNQVVINSGEEQIVLYEQYLWGSSYSRISKDMISADYIRFFEQPNLDEVCTELPKIVLSEDLQLEKTEDGELRGITIYDKALNEIDFVEALNADVFEEYQPGLYYVEVSVYYQGKYIKKLDSYEGRGVNYYGKIVVSPDSRSNYDVIITSGVTQIVAYENRLWMTSYDKDADGMLSADCIPFFQQENLEEVCEQLPKIMLTEDLQLQIAECGKLGDETVIYNDSLEEIGRVKELNAEVFEFICSGLYYVEIPVSWQVNYIKELDAYEGYGSKYYAKIVVQNDTICNTDIIIKSGDNRIIVYLPALFFF